MSLKCDCGSLVHQTIEDEIICIPCYIIREDDEDYELLPEEPDTCPECGGLIEFDWTVLKVFCERCRWSDDAR
jgi:hypothetical protein